MKLFLSTIMLFALGGCEQPFEWKGWVYPNSAVLVDDVPIGAYSSLEECRKSARNILRRLSPVGEGQTSHGDYECGFRCKPDESLGGINVCEKTER